MDIRKIQYFINVAEALSFSQASEQMHISRQALSKQIHLLERELGAELLERSTMQMTMTEVGTKVYRAFKPLIRELEQNYDEVLAFVKYKKETLRIGYFSGLSYHRIIIPLLQWLAQTAPQLRIDSLALDSIEPVKQMLEEDKIDLAIYPEFGEYDWENKTCLYLKNCPAQIVVSENHPWYSQKRITVEDIFHSRLLVYENRPLTGEHSFLPQLQTAERIPVRNFDTYMGLLWQGKAFGIVDNTYSRREGNYKLFDLPEPLQINTITVAAYKRLHPLRRLLALMSEIDFEK